MARQEPHSPPVSPFNALLALELPKNTWRILMIFLRSEADHLQKVQAQGQLRHPIVGWLENPDLFDLIEQVAFAINELLRNHQQRGGG